MIAFSEAQQTVLVHREVHYRHIRGASLLGSHRARLDRREGPLHYLTSLPIFFDKLMIEQLLTFYGACVNIAKSFISNRLSDSVRHHTYVQ